MNYIEKNQCKIIIIIRDPRDLVCAMARVTSGNINEKKINDIIQFPGKYLSIICCDFPFFLKYNSFSQVYEEYIQWSNYPFVYTTRFEKLIGTNGGGDLEEQIQEILNIANHIDKPLTYVEAYDVACHLFGGTPTFKQGLIEDWKENFSDDNIVQFDILNRGLIEFLNY